LGDLALDERRQAVQPVGVVGSILDIVLRIRDGLNAYFGLVAASTLLFFALVVLLSLRLRRSELALMRRMGSARSVIATMIAAEIGLVVAAAALLTLTLTALGLAILQSRLGA
jgi:predicted lysophospholipase L1 biosynthesis ABC-type transport system permease subunit